MSDDRRPEPRRHTITAQQWRELIASLPPVDDEFAADVQRAREAVGPPDGPVTPSG
jgi:hypothetical protein